MAGNIIRDDRTRKTAYHAVAAILAGFGIWGVIDADQVDDYLQAAVLLLGTGGTELAAVNTPKCERLEKTTTGKKSDEKPEKYDGE